MPPSTHLSSFIMCHVESCHGVICSLLQASPCHDSYTIGFISSCRSCLCFILWKSPPFDPFGSLSKFRQAYVFWVRMAKKLLIPFPQLICKPQPPAMIVTSSKLDKLKNIFLIISLHLKATMTLISRKKNISSFNIGWLNRALH